MNFYTLDYDCNTPTVQQINIPTNTDYKVGMKVRRNGEIQNLSPDNFTITDIDGNTLSADADKTNGYVTFTKSSGDDASFKQYGVHIDKGYDFNDYVTTTGLMTSTASVNFPTTMTAESLGIAGQKLTMDNFKWGNVKRTGSQPTVDDITTWTTPNTNALAMFVVFKWPNGRYAAWCNASGSSAGWQRSLSWQNEDGTEVHSGVDEVVIDPSWYVTWNIQGIRGTANNYYILAIQFQLGTPFSADFKLNINEFKSQKGDINLIGRANTVNFAGTDGQGKSFSYDVIVK